MRVDALPVRHEPSGGRAPDNFTPSGTYTAAGLQVGAYEKYWQDHETRRRIVMVGRERRQ